MTFAADRNPDNVFDIGTHRQKHSDDPVPISQKIAERELERREAMDDGDRTVAAMYHNGLGTLPPDMGIADADLIEVRDRIDAAWEAWTLEKAPKTDDEAKETIAREVDASRPQLVAALKAADRDGLRDVQSRLAAVVDEIDRIQRELATRGDAA